MDISNLSAGEFLTSLQVAVNGFGAVCKSTSLCILLWRMDKVKELMDQLDKCWRTDGERQKIHNMVALCNYILVLFGIVYFGYTQATFLSYTLNGKPPWSVYNPFFDWRIGKLEFWTQALLEETTMSFAAVQNLVSDTYTLLFLIIMRTHYGLLKGHVERLRRDLSKTESENYDDLVSCILEHKLILSCCQSMRPIISATIFVQFLLVGIILGITLVNIFFFSTFWEAVSSFVYLVAVLMETFPFCYICNMFIDDCYDMSNAIFTSNWMDAEPRYKSTLIFFMTNTQRPFMFTAGGIFPITVQSNVVFAKFAFSIITIVQQFDLGSKLQ
ncbi:odorant receptor 59b [Drosophila busckii]|uniref:odorant receptor 59b n=1 Tax=Drosophila busckii TaxID=30019 RepID=UPI00083F00EC|nr:odorant receptor 59b [Drosophila busckii]